MQKTDSTTPLDRNNLKTQDAGTVLQKANQAKIEGRKILNIKPFGKKPNSETPVTKAKFMFNTQPFKFGNNQAGISGKIDLKPTSSMDFFKRGISSNNCGEINLNSKTASLDFFKGTKPVPKKEEPKKEESKKEEPKKEETKKPEEPVKEPVKEQQEAKSNGGLFGNFVKDNKIGSGLFSGLVKANKKDTPQTNSLLSGNKPNSLFGSTNNSSGLFSQVKSSLFGNLSKPQETPQENNSKPNNEPTPAKPQIPQPNPSLFNNPDTSSLFGKPVKGGLFDKLSQQKTTGLFSGLGNSDKNGTSSGLFSKLPEGVKSNFFQNNDNEQVEEDEDEEEQKKDESVDESKVKYLVTFESNFETLISKAVRNFKTQKVGGPAPDGGFGNGKVSLEKKKT